MAQPSSDHSHRDQAARLRELAAGGRSGALILAVTSGKGGVGKSSIAVNLSVCLATRGLRVTLADVDLGLANADLLLNLHPRHTLQHVVGGIRTMDEIAVAGPGGLRFIPGASGLTDLANLTEFERENLIAQLKKLRINTDIVVLDCGAGIARNVTSFAHAADFVLVVTTPQPTAVTDAYATIKTLYLAKCRASIGLVVNMARSRTEANATYERLSEVARRFLNYSIANLGHMLHDTAVEQAVLARCPFVLRTPGSHASACMAAIGKEVTRRCTGRDDRGGFLRRVAGLFV